MCFAQKPTLRRGFFVGCRNDDSVKVRLVSSLEMLRCINKQTFMADGLMYKLQQMADKSYERELKFAKTSVFLSS